MAKKKETKTAKAEIVKTNKDYSYRVTEKATKLTDNNVLVFNILDNKNKIEITKDLEKTYKVNVLGIRIVNTPAKKKVYRGRIGYKSATKKAYITLAKGQSIVLA